MSKKRAKQYLMLLCVIGLVSVASGSGTFASFSAQTTNPGNTFASGTLFLHDTPNGGTTCTSESATTGPNFNINPGDGSNGNNCAAFFTNASFTGGALTAHLALNDAGTIPTSDIMFDVPSCSITSNQANTGSSVTFGSAPTCAQMYITVQETQSNYTTNVYCAYGTDVSGTCAAPSNTLTLANTNSLQTLLTTGAATATLAAGGTRYYVITVSPGGVASDNTLQNRLLTFGLTWHIDQ